MSDSSGSWQAKKGPADDPLAHYRKQPIISRTGPDSTYLGRVIIELYDDGRGGADADNIAVTAGAMDGQHAQLLERVEKALATRLQRGNPLNPTS